MPWSRASRRMATHAPDLYALVKRPSMPFFEGELGFASARRVIRHGSPTNITARNVRTAISPWTSGRTEASFNMGAVRRTSESGFTKPSGVPTSFCQRGGHQPCRPYSKPTCIIGSIRVSKAGAARGISSRSSTDGYVALGALPGASILAKTAGTNSRSVPVASPRKCSTFAARFITATIRRCSSRAGKGTFIDSRTFVSARGILDPVTDDITKSTVCLRRSR